MPDYWLPRSPKKACVIVSRLAAGRRDNFKAAGVGEGCADLYIGDSGYLESKGIGLFGKRPSSYADGKCRVIPRQPSESRALRCWCLKFHRERY